MHRMPASALWLCSVASLEERPFLQPGRLECNILISRHVGSDLHLWMSDLAIMRSSREQLRVNWLRSLVRAAGFTPKWGRFVTAGRHFRLILRSVVSLSRT